MTDWSPIAVPLTVATLAMIAPGATIVAAGWGVRRLSIWFLSPALSLAVLALAAVAGGALGAPWGPVPVAATTVVVAAIAFGIRRLWVKDRPVSPRLSLTLPTVGAFLIAALAIVLQLMTVFGQPSAISQTFDAIVHLNTVRYAMDTANASAFHIGATSDIGFYPNAWHALASLIGSVTGSAVPVAVNAADLAIGAIAWPASVMALALVMLGERRVVGVAAAALSTGFGAFPILLFDFGVLYPNATAFAILPAGLAAVWMLLTASGRGAKVRVWALLLLLVVGIGLAHPNAALALYAMGAAIALIVFVPRAIRADSPRRRALSWTVVVVVLGVGAFLWWFGRTGWAQWKPWQSVAQAVGEGLLISPRGYPVTAVVSVLLVVGVVALIRHPRSGLFAVPFVVALFMFVLASGTSVDFLLRKMVTNPWYNDPFRLAALLPVVGIPVAVFGAVTLVDAVSPWIGGRRALRWTAALVGSAVLLSVAVGPNISAAIGSAQVNYRLDASSALLTGDEAELLARLDQETPPDALIAGSPWTGASLAYALADRDVVELHVFGDRSPDERYLDAHLRDIDDDPAVCAAIRAIGVTHVLDFGTQNVFNQDDADADRDGIEGIGPTRSLALVDAQGDARLYRVVGC